MRKELSYEKRIVLFGTEKEIGDAEKIIATLNLSFNESFDRLILQDAIDNYNIKADILYDGNTIIPYKHTLREFRKYNRQGTLDNLSNYFYEFLHLNCNDIAHYSKEGYIDYYDNSFYRVKNEVINRAIVPNWKTDLIRVFEEIKNK